jgi:hypothetical protein
VPPPPPHPAMVITDAAATATPNRIASCLICRYPSD